MKTKQVIQHLKSSHAERGGIRKIHLDTGLDLSWLYKVARGDISQPSSLKVERLGDYFDKSHNPPQKSKAA